MGIFKKLGDFARANLNQLIGHMEDHKKLTDQAILELAESKKKAQSLMISVTAALKHAQARLTPLMENAAKLVQQAEDFLRVGDEEGAKNILRHKQEVDFAIRNLEQEIDENTKAQDAIKRGIKAVDEKISSMQSASTIAASNDAIHNDDAFSTFARMEEKIEAKEHEVAALNELLEDLEKRENKRSTSTLSFDKHSDPSSLEKELEAIKNKLNK